MLRDARFIARRDLAHLVRQRETIVWVFVMPILFFYFIGTVTTGGIGPAGSDAPRALALQYDGAPGVVSDLLEERLVERGFALVDDADTVLSVPSEDLSAAVAEGDPTELTLRLADDSPQTQYDQVLAARAVYGVVADVAVVDPLTVDGVRELRARPRALELVVRPAGERAVVPLGFEQAIPGMLVMFTMLVLLTSGATLLVIEREQGLLRRLAATPISRGSVVLGKWLARMALALVQVGFGLLSGSLLFSMDWGRQLPAILLVLLAWAAFNASLGLWLGCVGRTQGQTVGLGLLTTMSLAALGGCWWPIEITPAWMQGLSRLLPTGIAMDAMHRLVSFGQDASAVVPHFVVLVAAALFCGWLAARSFRYA